MNGKQSTQKSMYTIRHSVSFPGNMLPQLTCPSSSLRLEVLAMAGVSVSAWYMSKSWPQKGNTNKSVKIPQLYSDLSGQRHL